MEQPFKIGDTVTLNSGGNLMTIVAINRKGVTCAWLVKGQAKSKLFPSAALTKAGKPVSFEQIVSESMKIVQERRDAAKIVPLSGAGGASKRLSPLQPA